ncbi:hypothetical protein [Cypionkella sinensis]|uniref:Lipoprotein n=1 Tax=Cypionkella sinensis TaxID=1756043 RepID=A0ABV7IX13_9RHOB
MVKVAYVVLLAPLLMAGCPDPNQTTTQPSRDAAISANDSKGCELKNPTGTGFCEDGRHGTGSTAAERAARKQPSDPYAGFTPSQCETGMGAMGGFWGNLGRVKQWQAYCAALENGELNNAPTSNAAATARPAPQAAAPIDDGDHSGTWYCDDSVDGAGNYGTWEMTQHPERFYDCKRVN